MGHIICISFIIIEFLLLLWSSNSFLILLDHTYIYLEISLLRLEISDISTTLSLWSSYHY